MTINKYTGKTKEEAIAAAKAELGDSIVIMNTKNKKPEGLLGIVKPSIWEVTVAVEDDTDGSVSLLRRDNKASKLPTSTFSVAADEKIDLNNEETLFSPITPVAPIRSAIMAPQAAPSQSPAGQSQTAPQPVHQTGSIRRGPEPKGSTMSQTRTQSQPELSGIDEVQLKDAFREITEVLSSSNIIKSDQIKQEEKSTPASPVLKKTADKNTEPDKPENIAPAQTESNGSASKKRENNLPVVRMVYNTLIENEVDERYVNQIFDDMGNVLSGAGNLDLMISNIYQKMVLKFGTPKPIELTGKGPLVVFFIGPTGVGKTTTIAKIASMFKIEKKKQISFITADTYRIAATEQLNVYANILDAPFSVIYGPEELNDAVESMRDQDLILVDTVGFSHKNEEQRQATKDLLSALDSKYRSDNYLVLSVTTKYNDLKEISDSYSELCKYNLIFTKLDETKAYGNILNIRMRTGAELSYVTNGQKVPDDIETIDSQKLVKAMLGGN